jgi:hypothetical protein
VEAGPWGSTPPGHHHIGGETCFFLIGSRKDFSNKERVILVSGGYTVLGHIEQGCTFSSFSLTKEKRNAPAQALATARDGAGGSGHL